MAAFQVIPEGQNEGVTLSRSNGLAHLLPRNQSLFERAKRASKEDLRGQQHALVGRRVTYRNHCHNY